MYKFFSFLFLILMGFSAQAQQEITLPTMQDIPNSVRFNPAFTPGYKWTISLPSVSNSLVSNANSVNKLFTNNGSGSYTLSVGNVVAGLADQNYLNIVNKVELFGISHQWKNSFVHFNLGTRTTFGLDFPKGLAQLAAFGNGPYIGKTMVLGPEVAVQSYTEFGLGFSQKFGRLRIGATIKMLNGVASAQSVKNKIDLYTDPEYYQLTATTDYELQTSSLIKINASGGIETEFDQIRPNQIKKNRGIGYDFGAVLELTDKFLISAAVTDLGHIKWSENSQLLSSKGVYTFEGVSLANGLASVDSTSIEAVLDSVQSVLNFKSEAKTFSTPLAQKLLVGATYKYGKSTTLSGMFGTTKLGKENDISIFLSGRTYVKSWLAFGGVIAYRNKEIDHLGLNATLKVGPVQLYVISDNALSYVFPTSANDIHLRVGLNVMMGKIDKNIKYAKENKKATGPHL